MYARGPEGLNRTVKVRATITADRCETREMPRHQMAHDRCNLIPLAPGAFAFDVYVLFYFFLFYPKHPFFTARVYFKGLVYIYLRAFVRPLSQEPARAVYLYLFIYCPDARLCYIRRCPSNYV